MRGVLGANFIAHSKPLKNHCFGPSLKFSSPSFSSYLCWLLIDFSNLHSISVVMIIRLKFSYEGSPFLHQELVTLIQSTHRYHTHLFLSGWHLNLLVIVHDSDISIFLDQ